MNGIIGAKLGIGIPDVGRNRLPMRKQATIPMMEMRNVFEANLSARFICVELELFYFSVCPWGLCQNDNKQNRRESP